MYNDTAFSVSLCWGYTLAKYIRTFNSENKRSKQTLVILDTLEYSFSPFKSTVQPRTTAEIHQHLHKSIPIFILKGFGYLSESNKIYISFYNLLIKTTEVVLRANNGNSVYGTILRLMFLVNDVNNRVMFNKILFRWLPVLKRDHWLSQADLVTSPRKQNVSWKSLFYMLVIHLFYIHNCIIATNQLSFNFFGVFLPCKCNRCAY